MLKSIPATLFAAIALAGCQPATETTQSAAAASMSMVDQVASATCKHSVPERDNWLRAHSPSVAAVEASYRERSIDPEQSAVFRAYRAYMNSGKDHAAAAAAYGDDYPDAAACFS